MNSAADFYVFDKWADAPAYAFGGAKSPGIVPPEDKEAYWRIFSELKDAAQVALTGAQSDAFILKPRQYSRERGARGHRPTDLWVSACHSLSDALGYMPQVYAIASERGLEIGFAASINEADYFDQEVKARNRTIVPFINRKLPAPSEALTQQLDAALSQQGGWHFNAKNRLVPGQPGFDKFSSLADLLASLKANGDEHGGGVICRIYPPSELAQVDLAEEFDRALSNFAPLVERCMPTSWDAQVLKDQDAVAELGTTLATFDPAGVDDGRKKVLTAVARRQGQGQFRDALVEAYEGKCAVTGTSVQAVLHAAHITPYLGPETNHVTNGLLLRADIHTLFDLGMIRIDPNSLCLIVSHLLDGTMYATLDGKALRLPSKPSQRPSPKALAAHFSKEWMADKVMAAQ